MRHGTQQRTQHKIKEYSIIPVIKERGIILDSEN